MGLTQVIVYGTQWIVYGTSSMVGHGIVHGTQMIVCGTQWIVCLWDSSSCLFMGLRRPATGVQGSPRSLPV